MPRYAETTSVSSDKTRAEIEATLHEARADELDAQACLKGDPERTRLQVNAEVHRLQARQIREGQS